MNSLLLPYLAMASLGLVLKRSIALRYSGLVKSLLIFWLDSTELRKLSFIHYFRVSSR